MVTPKNMFAWDRLQFSEVIGKEDIYKIKSLGCGHLFHASCLG